jgi:hypothetical protein
LKLLEDRESVSVSPLEGARSRITLIPTQDLDNR